MIRLIALKVSIAVLVTAIGTSCGHRPEPLEDQPGWNCQTMGNRHC